jgi:hypothetical protein
VTVSHVSVAEIGRQLQRDPLYWADDAHLQRVGPAWRPGMAHPNACAATITCPAVYANPNCLDKPWKAFIAADAWGHFDGSDFHAACSA